MIRDEHFEYEDEFEMTPGFKVFFCTMMILLSCIRIYGAFEDHKHPSGPPMKPKTEKVIAQVN